MVKESKIIVEYTQPLSNEIKLGEISFYKTKVILNKLRKIKVKDQEYRGMERHRLDILIARTNARIDQLIKELK